MSKNRWISDLHWRREGQQTRSGKTQNALLDATESLLIERGVESTSMQDVAQRAGSSIGALYHHFKDKTALLYALFDRMTKELEATNKDALDPHRWQGASVMDILRGFLEFSLSTDGVKPSAKLAGMIAMQGSPELRQHFSEIQYALYRDLKRLILMKREEIGHPEPDLAVSIVLDHFGGFIRTRSDRQQQGVLLTNDYPDQFISQSLEMAASYLQISR